MNEHNFKVNDKVRCIDNFIASLTLGKIYDVLDTKHVTVKVLDDENIEYCYFHERFELVDREINYLELLRGF
jgi:hypothetical protein